MCHPPKEPPIKKQPPPKIVPWCKHFFLFPLVQNHKNFTSEFMIFFVISTKSRTADHRPCFPFSHWKQHRICLIAVHLSVSELCWKLRPPPEGRFAPSGSKRDARAFRATPVVHQPLPRNTRNNYQPVNNNTQISEIIKPSQNFNCLLNLFTTKRTKFNVFTNVLARTQSCEKSRLKIFVWNRYQGKKKFKNCLFWRKCISYTAGYRKRIYCK